MRGAASKLRDAPVTPVTPDAHRRNEERFVRLKKDIHKHLIAGMDTSSIATMGDYELRRELRRGIEELCSNRPDLLTQGERERLVNEVIDETLGLGPIEPLLRDPTVCDILINGPRNIYVERRGKLEQTHISFHDEDHLLEIVQRIANRVGRRLDEASPMVDARLSDGSRMNAVIRPLALDGALVSIRRFSARPLTAGDLVSRDALTCEMVDYLSACVQARMNIMVSGGTGSGKTTLLNMLSAYIAEDERIATIEDAAELQLQQPHVARMETRGPQSWRDVLVAAARVERERRVADFRRIGRAVADGPFPPVFGYPLDVTGPRGEDEAAIERGLHNDHTSSALRTPRPGVAITCVSMCVVLTSLPFVVKQYEASDPQIVRLLGAVGPAFHLAGVRDLIEEAGFVRLRWRRRCRGRLIGNNSRM